MLIKPRSRGPALLLTELGVSGGMTWVMIADAFVDVGQQ